MRSYYQEINGLRAIAVLAVIVNHIDDRWMPSGFLGVDVFFVISGFVITASLMRYPAASLSSQLLVFYSRRVKRLFPALIIMVGVSILWACLFSHAARESVITGLYSLFGLSNGYLYWISADYFGQSASLNFFTHTWSLGVEEQFYLVYPVLFLMLIHQGSKGQRVGALVKILMLLCVVSLLAFVLFHNTSRELVFFMMPFRFWELGAGALVYLVVQKRAIPQWIHRYLSGGVQAFLLIAVLLLPSDYQVWTSPLVVLLTAVLLLSICYRVATCGFLNSRPLAYIGLISYSLYLWHWSVLVLARWTIGVDAVSIPALLLLMFILATLSYHLIEKRMRLLPWFQRKTLDIVAVLSASCILVALGLKVVGEGRSRLYLADNKAERAPLLQSRLVGLDRSTPEGEFVNVSLNDLRRHCNMTPNFLHGAHRRPKPLIDDGFLADCLAGSRPKLVLVGDSFSSVIAEHSLLAARASGYDFRFLYGFRCPYPLDKQSIDLATDAPCNGNAADIQRALLNSLNPGDLVVLRLLFYSPWYINTDSKDSQRVVNAYDAELAHLAEGIRSRQAGLLIIGQNGIMDSLAVCNNKAWFNSWQCGSTPGHIDMESDHINQLVVAFNDNLVKQFSGDPAVQVLDPLVHLCDAKRKQCWLRREGVYAMTDDYHLSQAAVDYLYDDYQHRLTAISEALASSI